MNYEAMIQLKVQQISQLSELAFQTSIDNFDRYYIKTLQ